MYALNVLIFGHQDLSELQNDRKRYRATLASDIERAIEYAQAIDLDLVLIGLDRDETEQKQLQRILELQQPEAKVITLDLTDLEQAKTSLKEEVKRIHDTGGKNSLHIQEVTL